MSRRPPDSGEVGLRHLDRRDLWLWSITLVLVLVQAAAILVLYWPEVRGQWDSGYVVPETKGTLATGLCGLIVVFCLYILNKQGQMRRLRVRLAAERIQREAMSSRLEELTALFEVATRMNPRIPVEAYLQAVVERLVPAVQVGGACIFLRSSPDGPLVCLAGSGAHGFGARGSMAQPAAPPFGPVLDAGATLRGPARAILGDREAAAPDTHLLALPAGSRDRPGVLVLVRHPHPFQTHEEALLKLFADRLGEDIERLAHVEQLEEQATRLEATHQRLTERERQEWRFFASLHQEIRQALASIAYRVEACEQGIATGPDTALAEHVPALSDEVRRLAAAVQEASALLDLDPLSDAARAAPAEVNAILEGALARVAPLAGSRGVAIEARLPRGLPMVATDAGRLGRALSFYLSEVLRRSADGGALRIATAIDDPSPRGSRVRCEILRLTGIESRDARSAPTLPGLLLRELVEAMGGEVQDVAGPDGVGLRIWLTATAPEEPSLRNESGDLAREAA